MNTNFWTTEDDRILRMMYPDHSGEDIARRLKRTPKAIKSRAKVLQLRKNAGPQEWTSEQTQILIDLYPTVKSEVIAEKTGHSLIAVYAKAKKLNLKKSAEFFLSEVSGRLKSNDPRAGIATQFRKGVAPWSKGRKLGSHPNTAKTQFKKGKRPHNAVPVGTMLPVSTMPYLKIKVAEPNKWEFLHRHVWRKEKGEIPAGHVVAFKDGNGHNCEIENLVLLTREMLLRHNSIVNYPPELQEAIRMLANLKRKINRRVKNDAEKQN